MRESIQLFEEWARALKKATLLERTTEWDIRLAPKRAGAASIEIQIETESFFTVSIASQTVEFVGDAKCCIELCQAVVNGNCSHTFHRKKGKIRQVDTRIERTGQEPFLYYRRSGFFLFGNVQQETVRYKAY